MDRLQAEETKRQSKKPTEVVEKAKMDTELLSQMGIDSIDVEHYEAKVEQEISDEVFGAAVEGFVRSKKDSNVHGKVDIYRIIHFIFRYFTNITYP